MSVWYAALLGALTGLHAATWGAFKDSPFEGFRRSSYLRSIVLAISASVGLAATTGLESTQFPVVLVGLLYAAERLATEGWKSFVREDDQAAYAIPMRMAVRGTPIDARIPRYALGAAVVLGLVAGCWAAVSLQPPRSGPLWQLVLIGGAGGWLTAVGGAWKDAPVEGFSGWKFLRSPVVATTWTVVLLPFTQSWVLLAISAGGLSVASIETYKTFLTGGRPPGKFLGKPVRWSHRRARERCRFLHSGLYVVFACGLASTLMVSGHRTAQELALLTMVACSSTLALLVAVPLNPQFAMLASPERSAARLPATAQEPDADADLRGKGR